MNIISLVIPVFAIIITGYLFARMKILPENTSALLIQFAYFVLIPALMFIVIAEESLKNLFDIPFILVFGGTIIVIYIIILFFLLCIHKNLGTSAMLADCCVSSNTGIIALPLLHTLFGHKALLPAAIANIMMVVMIIITMIILDQAQHTQDEHKLPIKEKILHVFKNPIILSTLAAILFASTGLTLPTMVKDYFTILSSGVTSCALFAIGMSLKLKAFHHNELMISLISLCKLIFIPALILFLSHLAGLSPILAIAATISAAVPTAKNTYMIAEQYQQSPELVSHIISTTTLFSTITLIVWLVILHAIYPTAFLH
ncbi:AEC family transporter [Shewanella surugensis]|uniref:AEC family transporter n=1 Tax=Shewanella surugensis TaxID=212020 RepID=A0ABT0LG20_9GAMM|nr:AEC family transporter [Shewanella surugensis]MCL1126297.1 AEC family transporter [Shewanella surugensis]